MKGGRETLPLVNGFGLHSLFNLVNGGIGRWQLVSSKPLLCLLVLKMLLLLLLLLLIGRRSSLYILLRISILKIWVHTPAAATATHSWRLKSWSLIHHQLGVSTIEAIMYGTVANFVARRECTISGNRPRYCCERKLHEKVRKNR